MESIFSTNKKEDGKSASKPAVNGVTGFPRSASESGGAAAATARSLYDQAKETAGQAYEAVSEKAASTLDEQKSTLSGGLSIVADGVRQVGDNIGSAKTESGLAESAAKYTGVAAQKIESVANYFETKSVGDMAHDLENFARRNPLVFFGAAFGLGLLAARFLKSTSPRQMKMAAGRTLPSARSKTSTRTFEGGPISGSGGIG